MIEARLGYAYEIPPDDLRDRMISSLKQAKDLDLDAWLDTWSTRALMRLPFPEPPFEGNELLQPLKSVEAMRGEGG